MEKILEAAWLSSSARNIEPWHFIVVTDKKSAEPLQRYLMPNSLFRRLVMVALGDKKPHLIGMPLNNNNSR
jgi:hypothetical protein